MEHEPVVFVVDDDFEVREYVRAAVGAAGFMVQAFADAGSFLQAFEPSRAGCLLLDARLDGMSGLELQDELAARRASIPVIVTSGHVDVSMVVKAMKAGAADVIQKPFNEDQLLNAVRLAVAEHLKARTECADRERIRERYALLTQRERQVAELVAAGMPSKAIATQLDVGQKTVEVYRSRVKHKMRARNAADLARLLHCSSV
jgi:two-component system response regulator FixJ